MNLYIVMVNFMSQLYWIAECPDFWLSIISRCIYESVLGRDLHLSQHLVSRLSKVHCSLQCEWPSFNPLRAWIGGKKKGRRSENLPSLWLVELEYWSCVFSTPGSNIFRLYLAFMPSSLWLLGFQATPLVFLDLSLVDSRSCDFSALIIMEANTL